MGDLKLSSLAPPARPPFSHPGCDEKGNGISPLRRSVSVSPSVHWDQWLEDGTLLQGGAENVSWETDRDRAAERMTQTSTSAGIMLGNRALVNNTSFNSSHWTFSTSIRMCAWPSGHMVKIAVILSFLRLLSSLSIAIWYARWRLEHDYIRVNRRCVGSKRCFCLREHTEVRVIFESDCTWWGNDPMSCKHGNWPKI